MDTYGLGFIPNGIFAKKFLNHSVSLLAISRATNSNSIIDITIIICMTNLHVIALPQL